MPHSALREELDLANAASDLLASRDRPAGLESQPGDHAGPQTQEDREPGRTPREHRHRYPVRPLHAPQTRTRRCGGRPRAPVLRDEVRFARKSPWASCFAFREVYWLYVRIDRRGDTLVSRGLPAG